MMRGRIGAVLVALAPVLAVLPGGALPVAGAPAVAQEARVALVIGNGAYRDAPLRNPVGDARAMAQVLREFGFAVTELENADRQGMDAAVRAFRGRLAAGHGVGLFYFAGHGVALGGRNYLLPVGQVFESESDVRFKALEADFVLGAMEDAGARVSLMVLDACRNNPFGARSLFRSATRGLAVMDVPKGSLLAYATAPGSTAADGAGEHGLYTQELIRAIREMPGADVEVLMKKVGARVQGLSGGAQVPYRSSSLTGEFYFRPGAAAAGPAPVAAAAGPGPVPAGAEDLFRRGEAKLFRGGSQHFQEALVDLIPAADQGHPGAQARLGFMYQWGLGVPASPVQALHYYRQAARQGDPVAQAGLASAYLGGLPGCGLDPDGEQALAWNTRAADQGHWRGLENLGEMYFAGRGVRQDQGRALVYFSRAVAAVRPLAEGGDVEAQNMLGYLYSNGYGVERDPAQGNAWFRRAADQGYYLAQANLGTNYRIGRGFAAPDPVQGAAWERKAADQGFAVAQANLGLLYETGRGVPLDPAQAAAWYRKAAELGNARGQFCYGCMLSQGTGVARDVTQAAAWYRKAAEQGSSDAQVNLGVAYERGQGVAEDPLQAATWYHRAADQGNPVALRNLGRCYVRGFGVPKDDRLAAESFQKAVDRGDAESQSELGVLYQNGRGVPKDLGRALELFQDGAKGGSGNAQVNLGWLYEHGEAVPRDLSRAVDCYRLAAVAGNAAGMFNLAVLYENGLGIGRDRAMAVAWYRKAAGLGVEGARKALERLGEAAR